MIQFRYIKMVAVVAAAALIFTACSDSTDSDTDDTIVPAGFALQLDGADIVRYDGNTISYDPDGIFDDYVEGNQIVLSMNEPFQNLTRTSAESDSPRYYTPVVRVRFIDGDGNYFDYPEETVDGEINPDGEYRLNWEWLDPVDGRPANFEQHGSDGSFGFHVRADFVGETGVIFRLDRCEGDRELVSIDGENTRVNQIRECSVEEETVWEAGGPMMIRVDGDYDLIDDNGSYPHNRHERIR